MVHDDRLRPVELADACQGVEHKFTLRRNLRFVGDVLVVAATAIAEVLATWFDAVGASFEHFEHLGAREGLLDGDDLNTHEFIRRCEGDEHRATFMAGHGCTTKCQAFGAQFESLSGGEFGSQFGHWRANRLPEHGRKAVRDHGNQGSSEALRTGVAGAFGG